MTQERINVLEEALADMVNQFAYWSEGDPPGQITGGLSALEGAFAALGYDEPHIAEHLRCDEPGCPKQSSSGWPTRPGGTGLNGGYRHTCHEHTDYHVNRRCNWPDDSPHWNVAASPTTPAATELAEQPADDRMNEVQR